MQKTIKKKKNHPQAYHPNIVVIYFNQNKYNINQKKLRQKYFQMLTMIIINDKINCWSLFKNRTVFPISLKTMLPCVPKLVPTGYDIWVRLINVKATKTPEINISWTQGVVTTHALRCNRESKVSKALLTKLAWV